MTFDEALDRPEAERLPFLESACSGDAQVFEAVVRLFKARAGASAQFFLKQLPGIGTSPAGHNRPMENMPRLGRYEILEVIGRGATGIVYRAFDPNVPRYVAIKVLREPIFASQEEAAEAAQRWDREKEVLGRLSQSAASPAPRAPDHGRRMCRSARTRNIQPQLLLPTPNSSDRPPSAFQPADGWPIACDTLWLKSLLSLFSILVFNPTVPQPSWTRAGPADQRARASRPR